ncbi:DUF4276 family protein [Armatimonas sp.]|uniref:DUF4276 family protein n=1 Tax=Armatimonas sp. TaxID=1872638 RepID=UPI003753AC20
MSTLGLILECGPDGPDEKVFRHWITTHYPTVTKLLTETLSNKRRLLDDCGEAARNLLADGCDHVVIVWDLYPSWEEDTPCLKADREKAFASLDSKQVPRARVSLVAIESMLECWFLADERAIGRYANCTKQPGKIQRPEKHRRPKDDISNLFQQCGKSRYLDFKDALPLAKEITDLTKLQGRCPTFARFWEKVTQNP